MAQIPKLLDAPYRPPRVRRGGLCYDVLRGDLRVIGISNTPIAWPLGRVRGQSRAMPIMDTELVRAVRTESALAVMHYWGVSRSKVLDWRKALEVPRFNPGTIELWREAVPKLHRPEVKARAVATWRARCLRLKRSRSRASD